MKSRFLHKNRRFRHTKLFKQFLSLFLIAAVADFVAWIILSDEYRHTVFDSLYLQSREFRIDILITFSESLLILCSGLLFGKVAAKMMRRAPKMFPLAVFIGVIYIGIDILAFGISYSYYKLWDYYTYPEFITSAFVLGSLSAMFTTVVLVNDFQFMGLNLYIKSLRAENKARRAAYKLKFSEISVANLISDTHFLHNSLGMLQEQIENNSEEAQNTIAEIIDITKYITVNSKKTVVFLQDEMQLTISYFHLMQRRFPSCRLVVDENLLTQEGYVVPLSVQMLVENAIKHNAHLDEKPLLISISLQQQMLEVKNNKIPLVSEMSTLKTGLKLLKERYSAVTHVPVIIQNEPHFFTVRLPILNNEQIYDTYENNDNRG